MTNNKVALVTGAGRGIGKAIALKLAAQGVTVVGVSNELDQVEEITAFLAEGGFKGQGFLMDVSNSAEIEKSMSEINSAFGCPNILVNNAGITRDNLFLRMSQEDWDRVIDTNLHSVFWLCKICAREMIKARWGRIVNIVSMVAFAGNPGQTNYSASKAAVAAFSKSLALEIASRGVTVNNVAPGFIETDMTRKLTDAQREHILSAVPMKVAGQPKDIANAVAFLASEEASYITGTTLHVNGGMFMGGGG